VADEHHVQSGAREARDFQVHLGDQRAGGIEHPQLAAFGFVAHARDTPWALKITMALSGTSCNSSTNTAPMPRRRSHHVPVVHNFVAHVHRRAVDFQGALHDLDGAVNAGTETTGIASNMSMSLFTLR